MFKPIYVFIGLRYLWNPHLTIFKKIITILSIVGISFGITSIIITLSLFNGLQNEFKKHILSFIPHIIITNKNYYINESKFPKSILKLKNIQKVSSFINEKVLIQNKKDITIAEILAFKEKNYSTFKKYNINNTLYTLYSKDNNIIIGTKLANHLNIKINDSIKLIVFPNSKTNFLQKKLNTKIFKVTGIFDTKNKIDNYQILMNTKIALNFLHYHKNYITGWRIWLKNPFSFNTNILKKINNNLVFLNWISKEGEIFQVIQMEKYIMLLFFSLILLIVGLNIIITLTINIIEKKNIIVILKTQGLCQKKIMLIFITLVSSITIIGNLLGTFISFILIFQKKILNLLINIFFENINIAIEIVPSQILFVNIVFILIVMLSTLYPIWNIINSTSSQVLSYE